MTECKLQFDPAKLKLIGAGGFGMVYLQPDNTVLKAIRSLQCGEAKIEFEKQKKIYDLFQNLHKLTSPDP